MATIRTDLPHPVAEVEDLRIPMPDGVRLAARLWRAEGAGPVPAVLEFIPYRKRDGTRLRDEMMHPYVAGHGYACLRVDLRGSGDSEGAFDDEYSAQEMADALEVIGWIARQPWCTGAVGMMGKSWGGFNCLQAAWNGHPALKAVISVCSTTDRFADDIHFKGGCLLGENSGWASVMLSYMSRPADPALRPDWRADWLARLEGARWLAPDWAARGARDGYWAHGSVCEDWGRLGVPVMIWGGWADNYMNTAGHLAAHAPGVVEGVLGPWVHQYPHTAVPGPQVGFLQMAVGWWDRWLKGQEAEGGPRLRAYVLHSAPPDACAAHRAGTWVEERAWPSPRVRAETWTLGAPPPGQSGGAVCPPAPPRGYLDQGKGERGLAGLTVGGEGLADLGLRAGEFFPMGLAAEMPGDQAEDDARATCFDGAVLEAPLWLLGQARLRLRLTADRPRAMVVARLCDVDPAGRSVRIAHGFLNLCHRDGMDRPRAVVPGEEMEVAFDLDLMGYRLAPGHRLRLALQTGCWPFVWPSPEGVTLRLVAGTIELPVHDGVAGDEWTPPAAERADPVAPEVRRPARSARRIEEDLIAGARTLVVEEDSGRLVHPIHGLETEETMEERWTIHPRDPLSARVETVWTQALSRGDWGVRTRAVTVMTGDATHLRMEARLTAWEGERQVFDRRWDDRIPRGFV
jgi:hypothetical protein